MTPQQIEALKLALEALEGFYEYGYDRQECFEHITAIKEALLEHAMQKVQRLGQEIEQEPVAWVCGSKGKHDIDFDRPEINALPFGTMLYTTPPQRTWVELTDEDRNDCLVEADPCECLATPEAQELMRCVETKLKELNHGK